MDTSGVNEVSGITRRHEWYQNTHALYRNTVKTLMDTTVITLLYGNTRKYV